MKTWVNYKEIKAQVNMEQVLEHYGVLGHLREKGDNLIGCCPIHQGTNANQFHASRTKNNFMCFGNCHGGGNGPCQLICTPLYSLNTAWHTWSMKAAPRVRSALFASDSIMLWSCHGHLRVNPPVPTPSISGRDHQSRRLALLPFLPQLP